MCENICLWEGYKINDIIPNFTFHLGGRKYKMGQHYLYPKVKQKCPIKDSNYYAGSKEIVSHQGLVLGLRSGVKNKAFFKKKMLFEEQMGLMEKLLGIRPTFRQEKEYKQKVERKRKIAVSEELNDKVWVMQMIVRNKTTDFGKRSNKITALLNEGYSGNYEG